MKKGQNILTFLALAAVIAFFIAFRIRRVKKAYLTVPYDHFINGTVLEAGKYVGYVDSMEPDLISTNGSEFSGAYPPEDLELKDSWIIEKRT